MPKKYPVITPEQLESISKEAAAKAMKLVGNFEQPMVFVFPVKADWSLGKPREIVTKFDEAPKGAGLSHVTNIDAQRASEYLREQNDTGDEADCRVLVVHAQGVCLCPCGALTAPVMKWGGPGQQNATAIQTRIEQAYGGRLRWGNVIMLHDDGRWAGTVGFAGRLEGGPREMAEGASLEPLKEVADALRELVEQIVDIPSPNAELDSSLN